jgi:hypothetical protein
MLIFRRTLETYRYIDSHVFQLEGEAMAQPQRLEIRFLGTLVRAEGIVGILGVITTIVAVGLATYFLN